MQNQAIHVLFLKPNTTDPFLNQLTAHIGQAMHGVGVCHVEISVPHVGGYLTSSIYNGENVSVNTSKNFSNPGYIVHTLIVSEKQVNNMKKKMLQCRDRADSFDTVGMCLACLPVELPRRSSQNTTFCSKYVTEVLQSANVSVVQDLNANITTPSKLMKAFQKVANGAVGTVPHKLKTLEQGAQFQYMRL
jgi:hypothetical protein